MISRSTLLHLRIPFSLFLLPVYFFALSISNHPDLFNVLFVFGIIHLLVYPASNGYNSFFDKDRDSIALIRNPPEVTGELYITAIVLDALAILLALLLSWQLAVMIFLYGLASKAYSHPAVRLKRLPFTSWFVAGFFQGFFSFLTCYIGMNKTGFEVLTQKEVLIPAVLSSMLLWGSYPMTQIYQHKEDSRRGDITLSLKLGIKGTFYFTGVFFTFSVIGFFYYYNNYVDLNTAWWFLAFLTPMIVYFVYWYSIVNNDLSKADFDYTMRLNLISSVCFSLFFLWIIFGR